MAVTSIKVNVADFGVVTFAEIVGFTVLGSPIGDPVTVSVTVGNQAYKLIDTEIGKYTGFLLTNDYVKSLAPGGYELVLTAGTESATVKFTRPVTLDSDDILGKEAALFLMDKLKHIEANVEILTQAEMDDILAAIDAAVYQAGIDPATGNPRKLYEIAESLTSSEMNEIKEAISSAARVPFPTAQFKYNTQETCVGEWIDGRKLFQKTYQFTGDGSVTKYLDTNSNIDVVGGELVHVNTAYNNWHAFPAAYVGREGTDMYVTISNLSAIFASGNTYYCTVRYCKPSS